MTKKLPSHSAVLLHFSREDDAPLGAYLVPGDTTPNLCKLVDKWIDNGIPNDALDVSQSQQWATDNRDKLLMSTAVRTAPDGTYWAVLRVVRKVNPALN